jgi:hypothetical protein
VEQEKIRLVRGYANGASNAQIDVSISVFALPAPNQSKMTTCEITALAI